jgi:hypothetical protein
MGEYLGPNYPYHKNITMPGELGMTPGGDMESLGKNIQGLISYASLLTFGNTDANKKIRNENLEQPLGDRIFVKTYGECEEAVWDGKPLPVSEEDIAAAKAKEEAETKNASEKKTKHDRYVFVDHIPTGNLPGMGNMAGMKGLIPGVLDNIFNLNPIKIINAMEEPALPKCYELSIETIKYNDVEEGKERHEILNETRWVSIEDLKSLNPCTFKKRKDGTIPTISGTEVSQKMEPKFQHPLGNRASGMKDGANCNWMKEEGFTNLFKMKNMDVKKSIINVKNKPIAKIFNASFSVLLVYLLYKVLRKEL